MAVAYAASTSHCQVAPLERASRPPSKYVAVALPCFCLRENFFRAFDRAWRAGLAEIRRGDSFGWRPASFASLFFGFSGARCAFTERERAYFSGCTEATCTRRPALCMRLPQCKHFDFVNTRFRRLGLAGQWCLTCSLTPRAVKKRPQCSQAVFFGDTFPCIA